MDIPMPFALSLVMIELKKANATKMTEIRQPTRIIIKPTVSGAFTKSGIPAPTKKAKTIDSESPRNKLSHIFFRLMGWLNNNSINSELLYR